MIPNWDMIIVILFIVSFAYSVIIGINQTWKVVFSTYISILVADAIGGLATLIFSEESAIRVFNLSSSEELIAVVKIFIFALFIIMLTKKGKFEITSSTESGFMNVSMTLTAAVLSATLIIATITTYLLGNSLFENVNTITQAGSSIQEQSNLVRFMVSNYRTIFALPAIAFIITSFGGDE